MYKIGIDIGGTKINTGLFSTSERKLISSKKTFIKDVYNLSEHIKSVLEELCTENNINVKDIVSCGIGVPGTVSEDGKIILKVPNISILSDDIAAEIEKELKVSRLKVS